MEFRAETSILFPGVKGLQNPPVFAYPKLLVCLDCGFAESTLSADELQPLRTGAGS
jgi:hypothetical protein